ncbi:MAG: hypothetical protein ACJ8GK_06095 [Luteimonas sp.]
MNASVFFPSQLHWTSQELAEAVPLRLHELFAFGVEHELRAANSPVPRTARQRNYLPAAPAPDVFRVR